MTFFSSVAFQSYFETPFFSDDETAVENQKSLNLIVNKITRNEITTARIISQLDFERLPVCTAVLNEITR